MEDRRTLRSGLPRTLSTELEGLIGALVPASPLGLVRGAARYRLERVAGRGVLFVTFQATRIDEAGAVPFAVKILRPSLVRAWPDGVKVLSREQARVLAILNDRLPPSPHLVRLLDAGELARDETRGVDRTVPWLALEWVDGGPSGTSLFARVRSAVSNSAASVDPRTALAMLRGIARGIDFVHQHGLLHRGLSPNNVLVVGHGALTITKVEGVSIARPAGLPPGFGFERGENESVPVTASLPYIAPEQFAREGRAQVLGPAVDVFAFAAVARFVLTGQGPMTRDGPLLESPHLHPTFRRVPGAIRAIDRALAMAAAFEPEERPATIESAWALLQPHLREAATRAETDDVPISPPRPQRARDDFPSRQAQVQPIWVWSERHRPPELLEVGAAAFDEEGHALLLARHTHDARLAYFDGQAHHPIVVQGVATSTLAGVASLGLGRWLLLAMGGRAIVLDEGRQRDVLREGRLVLQAACGEPERRLAIVGSSASSAPVLCVLDRGVARGPITLEGAAIVTAMVPLDDRGLVLVGRALTGGPYVATYDHELHHVRPQSAPGQAPLVAIAADGEGVAYAVGAGGLAVRITRFARLASRLQCQVEPTTTAEDLLAVAIDEQGIAWAAGRGTILGREPAGGEMTWSTRFRDSGSPKLLALAARRSSVLAMTSEGVVIEGRALGGGDSDDRR